MKSMSESDNKVYAKNTNVCLCFIWATYAIQDCQQYNPDKKIPFLFFNLVFCLINDTTADPRSVEYLFMKRSWELNLPQVLNYVPW